VQRPTIPVDLSLAVMALSAALNRVFHDPAGFGTAGDAKACGIMNARFGGALIT
jgi:hypothetical protein